MLACLAAHAAVGFAPAARPWPSPRVTLRLDSAEATAAKVDAACSRVRAAASLFGPEQARAAGVWVAVALSGGSTTDAEVDLFERCLLDDEASDGAVSKCEELNAALDELRALLLAGEGEAEAEGLADGVGAGAAGTAASGAAPAGFEWGGTY